MDRCIDRLQNRCQVLILFSPRRGEARVLADRQQASGRIAPPHGLRVNQRPQAGEVRCRRRAATSARAAAVPGAHQDTEVLALLAVADCDRLAARQVANQRAQRCRQLDIVHQQQLTVEHATDNADGAASRRDVRRQATAEIQRQAGPAEPLLEQDEAAVFTDVAASLVALQQHAIDDPERRLARFGRAHFSEDLEAGATQLIDVDSARRQRLKVDDQPAKTPR